MKYGLLDSSSLNIGNEIQSVTVKDILPRMDCYLDGDYLNQVEGKEEIKLIVHGAFSTKPENWPPAPCITPLFVSFHISEYARKKFIEEGSISYFKKHEPIGCRDYNTMELLDSKGVKVYFSGCITFTLGLENRGKGKEVLLVDLDEEAKKSLPKGIWEVAREISHVQGVPMDKIANCLYNNHRSLYRLVKWSRIHTLVGKWQLDKVNKRSRETREKRFEKAKGLLDRYSKAKFVITSRLHCALPCMVMGTPVIFVHRNLNDLRFKGLLSFVEHYSIEEFKEVGGSLDTSRITKSNRERARMLGRQIEERCKEFLWK